MNRSIALRSLLMIPLFGVLLSAAPLSAQDAPVVLTPSAAEAEPPSANRAVDAQRFSPAAIAASAEDERPPRRAALADSRLGVERRHVRRVRFRRAAIAVAVLAGVASAVVGAVRLAPDPEPRDDSDNDAKLLGLLLLLGG